MKKRIAILGATGSIGTQALEVVRAHSDLFEVEVLTAQNNASLLIKQALEFLPNAVVIANEQLYSEVKEALSGEDIKVFAGDESVSQIVEMESIDIVLLALVGYSGLKPAINAIKHKKRLALANKETLVVAGEIIVENALANRVQVLPVDSEHSAIFQCLVGEYANPVEKIYLTASGGPFRGKRRDYLSTVKKEEALRHPNWSMGCKITIDSATLVNKGLEVIEARWLFDLQPSQIDVIIHPQSVIHSLVQFCDGSIKAQMGLPDMKLPIHYALNYPDRVKTNFERFNFADYPSLTFEKPDRETFECLDLAYMALNKGGNMPCILNASNEVAVEAFLKDKIGFLQIPELINKCMNTISFVEKPNYETLVETHKETITFAKKILY
ncbi:MAG: 1-deoxy-D-xylulose-5-phosphate reductoisomerase [Bacteroidales bacterium]|nr:1-deoxy-D-xylulose-5-phosphate reductoisomerase [Bacteroidales bacterium]